MDEVVLAEDRGWDGSEEIPTAFDNSATKLFGFEKKSIALLKEVLDIERAEVPLPEAEVDSDGDVIPRPWCESSSEDEAADVDAADTDEIGDDATEGTWPSTVMTRAQQKALDKEIPWQTLMREPPESWLNMSKL
jgi:hypothetical protein